MCPHDSCSGEIAARGSRVRPLIGIDLSVTVFGPSGDDVSRIPPACPGPAHGRVLGSRRELQSGRSNDCLGKQVIVVGMATVEPLSPTEEELWRAVMRIVKVIPRHLDSDLIRDAGLTASDYTTIMHLSEAPNRELRMADLATATDLSASRMTRLVDDLQSRGLVTKTVSSSDARGNVARLTPRGMAKLKSAWPVHLASVRSRLFDHLDASTVEIVARALSEVATHLEDSPAEPRVPR